MLDTDGTAIGALGRDSFVFGKLLQRQMSKFMLMK